MSRIRHATETFVNQMIAAVKKLIESNTNEINVLSGLQNGFKLYKDFTEIADGINNNTPIATLIDAMQDCSILICNSNGGAPYKNLFGILIIYKRDTWRADLKLTVDSGKVYMSYYNKDNGVGLKDWQEVATAEQIDTLSNKKFIRSDANTDGRDNPTKPSDYMLGLFTNQIKTFAAMGVPGGGFTHVIGINEWTDTTAGVHELIFAGTKVYHRESISADTWGQLYELATTEKIDISSSSLLNGWTMWGNGYGDNLVGCKTGKQVQLNGLLRCGVKTQNTLILTLPKELRPTCSIIKNVSCYPYGTATIEIQSVGNVLVGNIGEGTLAISMGDVSYSTL